MKWWAHKFDWGNSISKESIPLVWNNHFTAHPLDPLPICTFWIRNKKSISSLHCKNTASPHGIIENSLWNNHLTAHPS